MNSTHRDRCEAGIAPNGRVLYLLSSAVSARLVKGQLGYIQERGYTVQVATNTAEMDAGARFDEGVPVVHVGFTRRVSPLLDALALLQTLRAVRRFRPDAVNASTPKAGLLGMIAARLARVPVRVYVVRGLRYESARGSQRWILATFERLAISSATDVVFNSSSALAVAERDGVIRPGRGSVLGKGSGNGVDTDRFVALPSKEEGRAALGLPEGVPIVGFVGRLTRAKGIADLLRVHALVRAEMPAARLVLVGVAEPEGPEDEEVLAAFAADEFVHVLAPTENVGVVYRACDVIAFPSYREGLPNVVLEAQYCGTPVVAYAATGTVDALVDGVGGFVIELGDDRGLAQATLRVLRDSQLRAELGRAGSDWVAETFRREVIWDSLLALYGRRGAARR